MMASDTVEDFQPLIPWRIFVPLLIFIFITTAVTIVLSHSGIFIFDHPLGIYRILPGDILFDFFWIYAITIVIAGFVYLILPALSSLALKAHRFASGGTYNYHMQSLNPRTKQRSLKERLLMPSLVCLGFSLI